MRRVHGFTVVELVVVMVIMAILLTLAGFSINSMQANTRDGQRNADIADIARGLETRYKEGDTKMSSVTGASYVSAGSYPDIAEMSYIMGNTVSGFTPNQVSGGFYTDAIPGTSTNDFTPPGITGLTGFVIAPCSGTCAVNDSASTGSTAGNAVTKDQYYYEPIDGNGNICNGSSSVPCVRYNLYWRTEVDNKAHILRSKHQ